MEYGILAYGAYLPRRRLPRRSILEANAWFDASLRGLGKGERTMGGWDEDPVTMAVDAARDALAGIERHRIRSVLLASTPFPFLDRHIAAVVGGAVDLREDGSAAGLGARQRHATTALAHALAAGKDTTLVVSAAQRRTKAASPLELTGGDGAAAILVGTGRPIARLLSGASATPDFVDHFRTIESGYDYRWEDRWVREEGLDRKSVV